MPTDCRLSPDYWWPMSAEADEILTCIATGTWPHPDVAERSPPRSQLESR